MGFSKAVLRGKFIGINSYIKKKKDLRESSHDGRVEGP